MNNNNITPAQITNELYNIFSDDSRAANYMSESFGPQYIGLCGWAGIMSPANRAAFFETFGRDVTERSEAEARARVDEYRASVEASEYHRHELEADNFAAYGSSQKSQLPEVGAFVWVRWSCLKGDGGPMGELEHLELMDQEGSENPRRLCEVVAVVDASQEEFLDQDFANGVARQFKELGGTLYVATDPSRLDGYPMSWEAVFCVRCADRWYLIDGQGYSYTRYLLFPEDFRQMYAPELTNIKAAREQREADERAEEQRQAEERRDYYLKRCAKWAPYMTEATEAQKAYDAISWSDKKAHAAALRKLGSIRRGNISAMIRAAFPALKFSVKKWDGWGGAYEVTYIDGPTEKEFTSALDLDLFESVVDTFDGMTDSTGYAHREFTDFAHKYMGNMSGEIRVSREMSDDARTELIDTLASIAPAVRDVVRSSVYLTMEEMSKFAKVTGLNLSDFSYYARGEGYKEYPEVFAHRAWVEKSYMNASQVPSPTDPTGTDGTPSEGSTGAAYGEAEESQNQDAPTVEGVEVVGYSEKALAIFGNTRPLADELKAIGAKFNRALTYNGERRAGWIISRRKADELAEILGAPSDSPTPSDGSQPDTEETPTDSTTPSDGVNGAPYGETDKSQILRRLEEIRAAILAENVSYEELAYLQENAKYIDPSDTLLLECAGVPEHSEDEEDQTPSEGSTGAPYGEPEKSQNQEADECGRTAETQAINASLVVVPAHVMRDFGFVDDSGEIVTNTGSAALLHPSLGFVCMPDDGGIPYNPVGGAEALAETLQAGGFLNFDGFRFVWPIEHNADSIRRVLEAYGNPEKSQNLLLNHAAQHINIRCR